MGSMEVEAQRKKDQISVKRGCTHWKMRLQTGKQAAAYRRRPAVVQRGNNIIEWHQQDS